MKLRASLFLSISMLAWCAALEAQVARVAAADAAQIEATVKQYYSLSHADASCRFSRTDGNGMPLDRRVHHRAYRDAQYTRIFKTVFSHALFALMKRTCVDSDKVTGMLDVRLSDSEIDSDPSNYGNDVRMKVTRPVRILVADPSRVRVRVDWSEMVKGTSKPYSVGRSDVILVKEGDAWLIDDVYSLGVADGPPSQLDMSIQDFEQSPGVVRLRGNAP
ncbi:hypothetical protein [Burkholderia ubonensis]|uniref:hypothetical protein n=1 Tax=Burkholderia ubonensis TaxID=101571 RepID=UPI000A7F79BB|nr:hypothetical protein [Burkholderia ubonensis]